MTDSEDGADTSDLLHIYVLDMERFPLLSKEDEYELGRRATEGDEEAIKTLVNHNLRWAFSVAKGYQGHSGMQLLDLVQEANLGLLRAARKFDYTKGYRFTTYATWWIRQAIGRAIHEQSQIIHKPCYIMGEVGKMKTAIQQLLNEIGSEPTREEIAAKTGKSVERIEDLEQWSRTPVSLDAPLEGHGMSNLHDMQTLADFLVDSTSLDMDEEADNSRLREHIEAAIESLAKERDKAIIRARFGIGADRNYTLEEVGKEWGITRERVRQREREALNQLRPALAQVAKQREGSVA